MTMVRGNTIRTPKGTYTTATLAARVGVSRDTIRRWQKEGLLPYDLQDNGKLTVYVYGREALAVAKQMKRGKSGTPLSDRPRADRRAA